METPVFDVTTLESVKSLVIAKTTLLAEGKNKVRNFNESMKNILDNDKSLSELQEKENESHKKVLIRQAELKNTPEYADLVSHKQEASEEVKDLRESLGHQLVNLYGITGVCEFEMPDGEVREFKINGVVKSNKQKRIFHRK